jgi:protease IV
MKFFLNVLATIVGLILFTIISFFMLIGIIGIIASGEEVRVQKNTVLHVNLNRQILEQAVDNPFAELGLFGSSVASPLGLVDIVEAIRAAAEDENIEGIYLESGMPITGYASLSEIREALLKFKESGKFIVAYSEMYSEGGYYLASVADAVHLFPEGDLDFKGIGYEFVSIKNTLDKIGVKPEIFRVGDFKSAIEPFVNETMSAENREQTEAFIGSIYNSMIQRMAQARSIDPGRLRAISDEMEVRTPKNALDLGLVDALSYLDQVNADIRERMGLDEDASVRTISIRQYITVPGKKKFSSNRIAVLIAEGNIVSGKASSGSGNIASETFIEEIRKIRKDKGIKAVVLRINSPGGSALASDAMWREIELLKAEKPVVASMSDVAASGGYYMAMGANHIVADETSITGSIGVFSLWFNVESLMRQKLGVNSDYIGTGRYSNLYSVNRQLTSDERKVFQDGVERVYETFTTKAAEGRNMPVDKLLAVASGRVWSGVQAYENGLIDEMGGLYTAIEKAAELAELEDYRTVIYPPKTDFLQELLKSLNEGVEVSIARAKLGELYPIAENIKALKEYQGVQARLPFELRIR